MASSSRASRIARDTARARQDALSERSGLAAAPKDFDWLEKNIPCQAACPAGTDIPGYLDAIARGDYEEAYRINLRDNVFPAVLGRVCTRPCEPVCRHGQSYVPATTDGKREPVAICFSKRSAADFLSRRDPVVLDPIFPRSGKKVAVVGGGAAGLAAARDMALFGHEVTVLERHHEAGGTMLLGIPHFRLPRELIRREVEQVRLQGVDIRCGVCVGRDVRVADLLRDHDAVVIAAGTFAPNVPKAPGFDLGGVFHGLKYLTDVNETGKGPGGTRVVVIGGGFTAVDCARTAKRLGAADVRMCYRRTESEMYITPGEVEEMLREGIVFETKMSPVAFLGEGGRVKGVRFARTEMGDPDAADRRAFREVPGSEFEVPADMVLLATGQTPEGDWLGDDERNDPRVFLAGDFGTGAESLIDAIADGRRCARTVDTMLMGRERLREAAKIEDAEETGRTRDMDAVPRQPMPVLAGEARSLKAEVECGFGREAAGIEARRCYLCHFKYEIDNDLCIYCDRCLKVKPVDGCIVKVSSLIYDEQDRIAGFNRSTGSRDYNMLYIDQSKCIRCGACKDVCPVECISLQKVSRVTVIAGG